MGFLIFREITSSRLSIVKLLGSHVGPWVLIENPSFQLALAAHTRRVANDMFVCLSFKCVAK